MKKKKVTKVIKVYKTPKEIFLEFGITPANLKKYRLAGHLVDVEWSAGGGKPYYEVGEIKKVFHK